ncbi:MAG TPA: hypothetical protein VJI52_05130 [Candidatus Nanoarchaeia archaeon]|nr:hypothetical protein [Candidatus Nanoarchaeia archaeon]
METIPPAEAQVTSQHQKYVDFAAPITNIVMGATGEAKYAYSLQMLFVPLDRLSLVEMAEQKHVLHHAVGVHARGKAVFPVKLKDAESAGQ